MSRYGMGAPVPVVEKDLQYAYPAPMAVPLVDPIAPINGPPITPKVLDSLKCPDGVRKWVTAAQMAESGCRSLGVKTQTGRTVQYQACCPLIVKGPGKGTYIPETMPLKPMPSAENLDPGPIEMVAPGKAVVADGVVVPGVKEMVMMKPEGFKPYTPTPVPTIETLFDPNAVVMAPPVVIPEPLPEPPPIMAPPVVVPPTMDLGPNDVLAPPVVLPNHVDGDDENVIITEVIAEVDAQVNDVVNNTNGNGATGGDWLTNTFANGDVLLTDGNGNEVIIPSDNAVTTTPLVTTPAGPNYLLWGGLGLAAAAAAWYFLRDKGTKIG